MGGPATRGQEDYLCGSHGRGGAVWALLWALAVISNLPKLTEP